MRLLVSGCTVGAGHWMKRRPDRLGVLMTPVEWEWAETGSVGSHEVFLLGVTP